MVYTTVLLLILDHESNSMKIAFNPKHWETRLTVRRAARFSSNASLKLAESYECSEWNRIKLILNGINDSRNFHSHQLNAKRHSSVNEN